MNSCEVYLALDFVRPKGKRHTATAFEDEHRDDRREEGQKHDDKSLDRRNQTGVNHDDILRIMRRRNMVVRLGFGLGFVF